MALYCLESCGIRPTNDRQTSLYILPVCYVHLQNYSSYQRKCAYCVSLCTEHIYKLMEIHQHFAGHMTKMAAMPIFGKNTLKIFFPGTTWQILMKLCMKHQESEPFIICANYNTE